MNSTSKPNVFRAAATYGLYIGLFLILCNLMKGSFFMMFVKLVGSIGLLVFVMKRYRDKDNGGYIDYGSSFNFGVLTSLFSTMLYVAFVFVVIMINTTLVKSQLYSAFDELIQKGIASEDAYPTFAYITENVEWFMPLILFIWSMFLGLVYSLIISAAIVRKKSIFEE